MFGQPLVQVQINENIKAPCHWLLWGESTDDRWIPSQRASNAENTWSCFHLRTSSWLRNTLTLYYLYSRLAVVLSLLTCFRWDTASADTVLCSEDECRPPNCACASNYHTIPVAKYRPQIVTISFDDEVTETKFKAYKRLFNSDRKNPNGCPISATFFLSDQDLTQYDLVRQLYDDGHEMACHSVTHPVSYEWWRNATKEQLKEEVVGMRDLLVQKTGIPAEEIRGMRMPFLIIRGDEQLEMMKEAGLLYDSSCMTGPYSSRSSQLTAWPYTWDYNINWNYCDTKTLPKRTYPGLWELPLNRWLSLDGDACIMVDGCQSSDNVTAGKVRGFSGYVSPQNTSEVLRYMRKNFQLHFKRGHVPLGMHMHGQWFREEYRLEAMELFLDELLERKDVYIVTMYQMIQWMQKQVHLNHINNFAAWQTSCKSHGIPKHDSSLKLSTTLRMEPPIKNSLRDDAHDENHDKPIGDKANLVRLTNNNYDFLGEETPHLPREGSFWPLLLSILAVLGIGLFVARYFLRRRRLYRRQR